MVKYLTRKFRPEKGFAHLFHLSFLSVIPILVFICVRLDLISVALAIILISKWRMLAVKPRHWLAHIRTNSVDIFVNLAILVFMTQTSSIGWQALWVVIYEVWILFIKPGESVLSVSAQALIGMTAGLTALFLAFTEEPLAVYVAGGSIIGYFSARHFFGSFEDSHARIYSMIWGLLCANILWVLGHWLLFAGPIAMPVIAICSLGYSAAGLYYLHETDKLTPQIRRQIYFVFFATMVVLLVWLIRRTTVEL